jgi:phage gp36-like protein
MTYNTTTAYIEWVGTAEAEEVTESSPPDTNRIAEALDKAHSEILNTLSSKYSPDTLSALDLPDLKNMELSIARWNLDQLIQPRDFVFEQYKLVAARLRRLSDGKDSLAIPGGKPSVKGAGKALWGNNLSEDLEPYGF